MATAIQTAVDAYMPIVAAALTECLADRLSGLVLFGSCARGTASIGSDIDLLLVVPSLSPAVDEAIAAAFARALRCPEAAQLRALHVDPSASVVAMSEGKLAEHPLILLDIVHEGRIIADPRGLLRQHFAAIRTNLQRLKSRRVVQPDGSWYWDLKPGMRAGEEVAI